MKDEFNVLKTDTAAQGYCQRCDKGVTLPHNCKEVKNEKKKVRFNYRRI